MPNKILNFHSVSNSVWFENTIKIIKKRFKFITIQELENSFINCKELKNSCHLTIDDGDKTFYNVMYPILEKHNLPATIFVSPSSIQNKQNFWFQEIKNFDILELKKIVSSVTNVDFNLIQKYNISNIMKSLSLDLIWESINCYKKKFSINSIPFQNMSIDNLLEINNSKLVEIGSHTQNHPILSNENDFKCKQEISGSITSLSSMLSKEIRYFAYPNGNPMYDFGNREINILESSGCKLAFSTYSDNFSLSNNQFKLPRYGFSHGNSFFIRAKLKSGKYWDRFKDKFISNSNKQRRELNDIFSFLIEN